MPAKHLEASVRQERGGTVLDLRGEINGFAQEALNAASTEWRRESVARSHLHFLGYVTAYPHHCANAPSALARLSPSPTALRRTSIALRGSAPLRS